MPKLNLLAFSAQAIIFWLFTITNPFYYINFLNGNTFTSLIIFVDILDEAAPQLKYWTGQATCDQASYHEGPSKKKTGPSRKLSRFQEFVLTMVRLRLSLLTFVLSDLFSISHSRVSQTFTTWINFMDCVFTPLLKWPSSARVRKHAKILSDVINQNDLYNRLY